uniref:Uncharacterized protein n=1 Tax=Alexandrium monilatum TaxID=311494 RepID=A0A7S4TAY5_9DINO
MSRALTVYSKRRDEDSPDVVAQLERVMASTGCSEPVARNLLKYGKLGIGPLAQPQAHERDAERQMLRDRARQSPPRQPERTAAGALAEKKRRLREQEERLRQQEEEREREVEAEEKARREEQARKRAGLTRLGPVLARQEEVDPLQQVPVQALPPEEEDDNSEDAKNETDKDRAAAQGKQKGDKKRGQPGQAEPGRRPGKRKRRRRRGGASESSEEGGEGGEEDGEDADRGRAREGGSSLGAASSLMTEAQVLEMMGKEGRKHKRGSLRAKSRIQREMEEWESAKRENPEFWKAPKFSLCYSAETRKSRNY